MLKLNLGANDRAIPGFVSVDIQPPTDVLADLRARWPWEDGSVDEVFAADIFEHLPDIEHTMSELWRVLRPGGRAVIEVPCAAHGSGAFQDPTHVSFWTGNTFEYFEVGNLNRERFNHRPAFRIIVGEHSSYQGRFDVVWKFRIELEAVK